jgi:ubiquitin C-terminal hydrolase
MSNKMFQKKIRPSPISDAFYELLIQIYENNNQIDYIDPNIFVEKITSLHTHFYRNQQHDAQEFCRFLLQDFNCELNEVENPSSYRKEIAYNKELKQMFIDYKNDCLSKENSFISDLFLGYFYFEYSCECGLKEYSFSQFLDLPVQMDEGFHRFDLLQLLKNTFKKKSIVNMAENCAFCNRTSYKTEMMRIASLPQILIISLQRINPDNGKKNNSPVNFSENMDLSEIIDTQISDNYSSRYNLFAVTNHVGEINTGHYFSYIKIRNIWFCFEDIRVYKIGPHIDLTNKEVYTLFYMRNNY